MDNVGDWLYIVFLIVAGVSGLFNAKNKKKQVKPVQQPSKEIPGQPEETTPERSFWDIFEEEEEEPATVSTASRARVTKVKARVLGEEKTATPSTPSIASRTGRMASARSGGNNHFKVNFEETSKGGNLTFQADDIVLYDADNDLKTKEDQLRLNGSIGLENINSDSRDCR